MRGATETFFFFASVTQLSDFIVNKYEGVFNINDTMTWFQSPISLLMSVTSPSDSVKVLCSLRNVIITQSCTTCQNAALD